MLNSKSENVEKTDRTDEICEVLKQGFEMLGAKLDSLEITNKRGIEFINQELTNAIKLSMKYERENAKQIISNNKKKLDEISAELKGSLNKQDDSNILLALKEYQLTVDALRSQINGIQDIVRHMDISMTETQAVVKVLPQVLDKPPIAMPMMQSMPMQMQSVQPAGVQAPVPSVKEEIKNEPETSEENSEELFFEDEPVITEELNLDDEISLFEEDENEEPVLTDEISLEEEPVITDEISLEEEPVLADEISLEEEPALDNEINIDETLGEDLFAEEEPILEDELSVEEAPVPDEIPESEPMAEEIPAPAEPEPAPVAETEGSAESISQEDLDNLLEGLDLSELDSIEVPEELEAEPEPAPEPEPEPVAEEIPVPAEPEPAPTPAPAPVSDDPNHIMTPEEIAALVAGANAAEAPAPEPVAEEVPPIPEPEPEAAPEPAPAPKPEIKIDPADANKQLSPDEIAALFAAMGQ